MSLTRFLPVPSDRMGILWSLLNIEDSIVVEYGPAGTTHFSMSLFGELGIEQENRLFTTHMREDDVVMGDVSRLENALVEVDRNFHPAAIFVSASSSSAVIGTDLRGVCTMLRPKLKARLVSFEQGGFRGDYSAGIRETYRLLAGQMVDSDTPKRSEAYNIIGASVGSYRCKADVLELERLMREAFGMQAHARLCLETDLERIRTMGGAAINLVLRSEALDAARILEKSCGTPYHYGAPYGYDGTISWLESVGKLLGREPAPALMAALKKSAAEARQYQMYGRMLRRDKPQAVLYGDYEAVRGLGAFLSGVGIQPVHRISMHNISALDDAGGVEYLPAERERIALLRGLQRTLLLADDTSRRLANDGNTFMRISTPVIDGAQLATHMPVMGPRGADMLMEYVDGYFNTLR
ncbi:MAG: nitrogenase component 1 [Oscillospiraceae bacterium]|nr:nitrogenase component 1 [Oscillospiraceae bacterium]